MNLPNIRKPKPRELEADTQERLRKLKIEVDELWGSMIQDLQNQREKARNEKAMSG